MRPDPRGRGMGCVPFNFGEPSNYTAIVVGLDMLLQRLPNSRPGLQGQLLALMGMGMESVDTDTKWVRQWWGQITTGK